MPNQHAGRLPKHFQEYRNEMLHMLTEECTLADMRAIAKKWVTKAKDGDLDALKLLLLYIFPAPPKTPDIDNSDNRVINVFKFPDWWQPPQLPEPSDAQPSIEGAPQTRDSADGLKS